MGANLATPSEALARLLEVTVYDNPYIHKCGGTFPAPKQAQFLSFLGTEACFMGSQGSGKSISNLAAALQFMPWPGYHAMIFGQTFQQLQRNEGIIARSREWLTGKARYNGSEHCWHFPNGNTLQFGVLDSEFDHLLNKGMRYHFYGFEELSMIYELNYTYFFGRAPVQKSWIPYRWRSTTNPDGRCIGWVLKRFYQTPNSPQKLFINSGLLDNPVADISSIQLRFANVSPLQRAQLLYGIVGVTGEGNMFKREWFRYLRECRDEDIVQRLRAWDLAATPPSVTNPDPDYTAGVLWYLLRNGLLVLADMVYTQGTPGEVMRLLRDTAADDGPETDVVVEREPGSAGEILFDHIQRDVLSGYCVYPFRPSGPKISRAKPLSDMMQARRVAILDGNPRLRALLDQLVCFPQDGMKDDFVDAASAGLSMLAKGLRPATAYRPGPGIVEQRIA